jgi:hypothetical protein
MDDRVPHRRRVVGDERQRNLTSQAASIKRRWCKAKCTYECHHFTRGLGHRIIRKAWRIARPREPRHVKRQDRELTRQRHGDLLEGPAISLARRNENDCWATTAQFVVPLDRIDLTIGTGLASWCFPSRARLKRGACCGDPLRPGDCSICDAPRPRSVRLVRRPRC